VFASVSGRVRPANAPRASTPPFPAILFDTKLVRRANKIPSPFKARHNFWAIVILVSWDGVEQHDNRLFSGSAATDYRLHRVHQFGAAGHDHWRGVALGARYVQPTAECHGAHPLRRGCGYFLSSFFTGRLLNSIGIGMLLAASSALVASSAFGYALAPMWGLFAACSLLQGLGSGAIDAGLNHYAAHHFSARHMNWLHACYSVGATLGPLIMTSVLARNGSWRAGYLTVAVILLCLALLFAATRREWDEPDGAAATEQAERASVGMAETLRHPTVWRQVALFFVYTGLEATVGQWSFTLLTESRNVQKATAGAWVTTYWASIGVGRILFGSVVDRLGIDRLIRLSTLTSVLGTVLLALNLSGPTSAVALALAGLGLAAIYPCLMTSTPRRLGSALAVHAIGFQVSAAMLGAAALPSVSGVLAERFGLETVATATVGMAFVVLLLHESLLLPSRRMRA
jgi:fucose permease